jgi:hypothetical protein
MSKRYCERCSLWLLPDQTCRCPATPLSEQVAAVAAEKADAGEVVLPPGTLAAQIDSAAAEWATVPDRYKGVATGAAVCETPHHARCYGTKRRGYETPAIAGGSRECLDCPDCAVPERAGVKPPPIDMDKLNRGLAHLGYVAYRTDVDQPERADGEVAMSLDMALSFAETPRRRASLQAPADSMDELYRALATLAREYRAPASPARQEARRMTEGEREAVVLELTGALLHLDGDVDTVRKRDLERAISLLSPPPYEGSEAGRWQPIETAPKDGRHVILGHSSFVTEGYFDCDEKIHRITGLNAAPMAPFTHWQPMPAPPPYQPDDAGGAA